MGRAEKELLSDSFGVSGIPSFVVLRPDGTVLTTDGRSKVMSDPKGDNLPDGWLPQPFNNVNDDPSPLNEEQCVIMLGSSQGPDQAVKAVAQEFYNGPDGSITEQLRKLTGVADDKLILLDIPSDGAFYVCDAAPASITE